MIGNARDGGHPVVAVNDTRQEKSGTVTVRDADSGQTLFSSPFVIPANDRTVVGHIPARAGQAMWLVDYSVGGEKRANHYLSGLAPFRLDDYLRWHRQLNVQRD
jgi:hypothetical protein